MEHVTLPNYHEKINQIWWICCTKDQPLFLCTNLHKDFLPFILMNFVENKSLIWKGSLGMNVKWLTKGLFNITWIQWRRRSITHWQNKGIDYVIYPHLRIQNWRNRTFLEYVKLTCPYDQQHWHCMVVILVEPNQTFEEVAQLDPWMVDCYFFSLHTKRRVAQGLKIHGSQNHLSYLGLEFMKLVWFPSFNHLQICKLCMHLFLCWLNINVQYNVLEWNFNDPLPFL